MSLSYLKKEKDKEKYTLEANKINKSNATIAKLQLDEFANRGMRHIFAFILAVIVKKNRHTLYQPEIAQATGYDLKYVNKCIRALTQLNMIRLGKRSLYYPCQYYIHPIFKTKEIRTYLASSFKEFEFLNPNKKFPPSRPRSSSFDTPGDLDNGNIITLVSKLTRVRETLGGYDHIFSTKKGEIEEIKKRITSVNKRVTYDIKGTGTLKLSLLLSQFYDPIIRLAYQQYRRYRKNVKHAGRYLLAVCKNLCKQFNVDYQYEDSAAMVKLSGYDYDDDLLYSDSLVDKNENTMSDDEAHPRYAPPSTGPRSVYIHKAQEQRYKEIFEKKQRSSKVGPPLHDIPYKRPTRGAYAIWNPDEQSDLPQKELSTQLTEKAQQWFESFHQWSSLQKKGQE